MRAQYGLRRMGILDDAIRDHLELKRRRGADPGEVAREQREALESATAGDAASGPEGHAGAEAAAEGAEVAAPAEGAEVAAAAEAAEVHDQPPGSPQIVSAVDAGHDGDETAELDMASVLESDAPGAPDDGDDLEWEGAGPPADAVTLHKSDETELEAGVRAAEDVPAEIPGQERLSFNED